MEMVSGCEARCNRISHGKRKRQARSPKYRITQLSRDKEGELELGVIILPNLFASKRASPLGKARARASERKLRKACSPGGAISVAAPIMTMQLSTVSRSTLKYVPSLEDMDEIRGHGRHTRDNICKCGRGNVGEWASTTMFILILQVLTRWTNDIAWVPLGVSNFKNRFCTDVLTAASSVPLLYGQKPPKL
ncbi:hypothetical protein BJV77DRAFT_961078 [Russula vinacea]|nr:hypothetical protein BJV77DRAFT_961078 [Russula vinacea]